MCHGGIPSLACIRICKFNKGISGYYTKELKCPWTYFKVDFKDFYEFHEYFIEALKKVLKIYLKSFFIFI